jgi:uncharacterized membrane protein
MNTLKDLATLVRNNPRLALAAATGDALVAIVVTLLVLALTGNLCNG